MTFVYLKGSHKKFVCLSQHTIYNNVHTISDIYEKRKSAHCAEFKFYVVFENNYSGILNTNK